MNENAGNAVARRLLRRTEVILFDGLLSRRLGAWPCELDDVTTSRRWPQVSSILSSI